MRIHSINNYISDSVFHANNRCKTISTIAVVLLSGIVAGLTYYVLRQSKPELAESEQSGCSDEIESNDMPVNSLNIPAVKFGKLPDPQRNYSDDLHKTYKEFSNSHYAAIQTKRDQALSTQARRYKVVIVGGGPGGLVAAYEAYTRGYDVTIIEKRNYARDQILRLATSTYQYVSDTLGTPSINQLMTNELIQEVNQGQANRSLFTENRFYTIEVRDFENSFATMLKVLAERDPNGLQFFSEHTFTHIVTPTRENSSWLVEMRSKSHGETIKVPADIVVGADGSKSFVHDLEPFSSNTCSTACTYGAFTFEYPENLSSIFVSLATGLPQIIYDGYELSSIEAKQEHLAWMKDFRRRSNIDVELEVINEQISEENKDTYDRIFTSQNRTSVPELDFVEKGVEQHLASLKEDFGWSLDRLPVSRFFTSSETVYLGCEYPHALLESLQEKSEVEVEEKLVQWSKALLKAHLPSELIEELMPRHGSAFSLSLNKTNRVHAVLSESEKKIHVFSLGDGYVTPHFLTGSGAQHAILMARRLGDLFSQIHQNGLETFDFAPFEEQMKGSARELHELAYNAGLLQPIQQHGCC